MKWFRRIYIGPGHYSSGDAEFTDEEIALWLTKPGKVRFELRTERMIVARDGIALIVFIREDLLE